VEEEKVRPETELNHRRAGGLQLRRCYLCGEEKPPSAFTQRVDERHYSMCRACLSEVLARSEGGAGSRA
jgi:hypothetical protein